MRFTPFNLKRRPSTVDLVIFLSFCLHNMLRNDVISHNPHNTQVTAQVEWGSRITLRLIICQDACVAIKQKIMSVLGLF